MVHLLARMLSLVLFSLLAAGGCREGTIFDEFADSPPIAGPIEIIEPIGDVVHTFDFQIAVSLSADDYSSVQIQLNGTVIRPAGPVPAPATAGGATSTITLPVVAGPPLRDDNEIRVIGTRTADGVEIVESRSFQYLPPKALARRIDDPADLIEGPLAHGRVGDYLLENTEARFVIQDVAQRDLYSVGAFGGNIIDAELVGRPGLDNFLEMQTMLNVETVLNAQELSIVNDGQNGLAAVISVCGPDDLLDFVNPSTRVADEQLGNFPAELDDNDQDVWACTDYSLEPGKTWIKVDTEVFNNEVTELKMIVGEWMNAGGEVDAYNRPGAGWGAPGLAQLGALSFTGYGEATGVDYSYTVTPEVGQTWLISISGVTVVLHHANPFALLNGNIPFAVPAGGSAHSVRYFGVGDGSSSNAVDLENEIKGNTTATIEGVVRVGGAPVRNARVSVGTVQGGQLVELLTTFNTDENGRYSGTVATPLAGAVYGAAAASNGALYEGGGAIPLVKTVTFASPGETQTVDFDLPANARVDVVVSDQAGRVPARITVVGFDPSPEPTFSGGAIPGFGGGDFGLFNDVRDRHPYGVVAVAYADALGEVSFDIEPGSYQLYVSRGPEYSIYQTPLTVEQGGTASIAAEIARVLTTPGFISSDFHVHGINSADSRVRHRRRALGYAADGIDNIVMTDHHVHTDLDPIIDELGLGTFVASTVGEEITTFDYGHFNAYPMTVDPSRPSKGSTDWAVAAPPGEDFPDPVNGAPAYNATPREIHDLATSGPNSTPDTTIQVNHIGSHFGPLQIDTGSIPFTDGLDFDERIARRLDPDAGNLFHHFPALELWNGSSQSHQQEFLLERIGIWMNHLNAGLPTTAIADTDSHRFESLRSAGAATWTAASAGADTPATLSSNEVARSVKAGRAVGGQGVFVLARLVETDGGNDSADLTATGKTEMTDSGGNVTLEIEIQAPIWAAYDTIEVYANATTSRVGESMRYTATPIATLHAGIDFAVTEEVVAAIPGASRLVTSHSEDFVGLSLDTWFVVLVKGTVGVSAPMFPVYADSLETASNASLADLIDVHVDEAGVRALGFTNALYFKASAAP